MKIVILVAGTEGDARPNVALGQGLAAEGHDIVVLTSRDFEPLVRHAGLGFAPLTADFRRMMEEDKQALDGKPAVLVAWRGLRRMREMARCWVEEAREAVAGAALIVGSGGAVYFASALAEAHEIAFVRSAFFPTEPSRDFPPLMLPNLSSHLPGSLNVFLHHALRHVGWQVGRPIMARLRAELGLGAPSLRGPWSSPWLGRAPILHAFSARVVTPPADWGDHVATTGFWRLATPEDHPSEDLRRFLARGPAPIALGFGSMVMRDPGRLASIIGDAIGLSGHRAVVIGGWGELAARLERRADILVLARANHDWLFPRVRLAVHHAGAGTTAAVLRAGIPSVAVPFLFDQFFWARRLAELGVAPPPLCRDRMTARDLADAIASADTPPMHRAASRLGALFAAEDGVANAIADLRRWNLLPARRGLGRRVPALSRTPPRSAAPS